MLGKVWKKFHAVFAAANEAFAEADKTVTTIIRNGQWRYRIVRFRTDVRESDLLAALNEYGAKGWELCGVCDAGFVLKRFVA